MWVKMDDRWPTSRKLRRVEPLDRLMWAMSIAYTSAENTDGKLDGAMVEFVAILAGVTMPYEAADRLVTSGLWDLDAGAWKVHDWHEYNFTAKQKADLLRKKAIAGQKGGVRSGQVRAQKRSKPEAGASQNTKQSRSKTEAVPSRPVPSRPEEQLVTSVGYLSSSSSNSAHEDDDDGRRQEAETEAERRWHTELAAGRIRYPNRKTAWIAGTIETLLDEGIEPTRPKCSTCQAISHTTAACPFKDQP